MIIILVLPSYDLHSSIRLSYVDQPSDVSTLDYFSLYFDDLLVFVQM